MKLLLGIAFIVLAIAYEVLEKRAKAQRAKRIDEAYRAARQREMEEELAQQAMQAEQAESAVEGLSELLASLAQQAEQQAPFATLEPEAIESVETRFEAAESAPALDDAGDYGTRPVYDFSGQMEGRWQAAAQVNASAEEQPEMHPEVETFNDAAESGPGFAFNLRDAILYDAILNPPYARLRARSLRHRVA